MSFRAFPFDKQYLNIQIQYGNKYPEDPVNIIPSGEGSHVYLSEREAKREAAARRGEPLAMGSRRPVSLLPLPLPQPAAHSSTPLPRATS